jgi:hypothetical protein
MPRPNDCVKLSSHVSTVAGLQRLVWPPSTGRLPPLIMAASSLSKEPPSVPRCHPRRRLAHRMIVLPEATDRLQPKRNPHPKDPGKSTEPPSPSASLVLKFSLGTR